MATRPKALDMIPGEPGACAWRLPAGVLRGPGFPGPVPEACDMVHEKLTIEQMRINGRSFDVRVISCESDCAHSDTCVLTLEATGTDTVRVIRLKVPARHMEHPEWISGCAHNAFARALQPGFPTRTFEFK